MPAYISAHFCAAMQAQPIVHEQNVSRLDRHRFGNLAASRCEILSCYFCCPTGFGWGHIGVAKTNLRLPLKSGVLTWQYHRFGAPVPAKGKAMTREEVLADLERSQKHPSWAARRVGAPVPAVPAP